MKVIILNTRLYIATMVLFTILFSFSNSVKSQSSFDTIKVAEKGAGVRHFYVGDNQLNFNMLMGLTHKNETAFKFMEQAYNLRLASRLLYITGGVTVCFAIVYISQIHNSNSFTDIKVLLPSIGGGVFIILCGGICEFFSKDKILKGVKVFNKSIKENSTANLNIGFSPTGMTLKLNF
jgi:hypothetical protein